MGFGFAIGVFGVLILAHAAYATIQYRGLLKILEEEFSGPPTNVIVELLLGLVFCISAALSVPGEFLSIHPDSEENRLASYLLNRDVPQHRTRTISSHVLDLIELVRDRPYPKISGAN